MACRHTVRYQPWARLQPSRATTNTSTPYIWISDAQLEEAFTRYLRVSHSQRRHQSNVPGPLEAKRRNHRRRIGSLGTAYPAFVSDADFGALFGAPNSMTRVGALQWSPPQQSSGHQAPHEWIPHNATTIASNPAFRPANHSACERQRDIQKGKDACTFSNRSLDALLLPHESLRDLSNKDLAPFMTFLQSGQDVAEADNVLRLVNWLTPRRLTPEAFQMLQELVSDKIKLGSITPECLQKVFTKLPQLVDSSAGSLANNIHRECYTSLQETTVLHTAWMDDTQRALVQRALVFADLGVTANHDTCIRALERLIVLCQKTQMLNEDLASEVLSRVLSIGLELRSTHTSSDDVTFQTKLSELLDSEPRPEWALRVLALSRWQTMVQPESKTHISSITPVATPALGDVSATVTKTATSRELRATLQNYAAKPTSSQPYDFAKQWFTIASKQGSTHEQQSNNPLGLLLTLWTRMAPQYRRMPEHVIRVLEHLATITAAAEAPFSSKQAFRWIWHCYQHLRQRGHASSSVLVRALLQAGVLRPLSERTVVSRHRLEYIVELIRKTEGSAIATTVQEQVHQLHAQFKPSIAVKQSKKDTAVTDCGTQSLSQESYQAMMARTRARGLIKKRVWPARSS